MVWAEAQASGLLLERRIGREWDWLTELGSRGPSEEWSRAYILWGVCGYSDGAERR